MIPIAIDYPYNLTNISTVHNIADVFTFTNSLTGNWFGSLIVIAVWIITFIITNRYATGDSFLASSFIGALVAILLNMIGMVSGTVVIMLLIMLAVGVGFGTVLKR